MAIIEPVIRPPAEANSFLLQLTTGCSENTCTFCGAYKDKPFRIKDNEEVYSDIKEFAACYPDVRRVFLMDGDVLVLKNNKLLPVLQNLNGEFLKLSRISSYANGINISLKTDGDLKELYESKLRLIYMGLESGSKHVLAMCKKKSTVDEMIEAVSRCQAVGIKSSVIVLLGLGGRKYSDTHVKETIVALNRMQPRYLSFLSVMLIPGTELFRQAQAGDFQELNSMELLKETYDIINGLELTKTVFRTNHASNYLSLEGRLGNDKADLLNKIKLALNGESHLRPDFLRGL